ncbi:SDR family oxidoreductase [Streptomyces sp. NPDC059590]|uniref:SDR family oxidoreductase n=1 Tax=unclassified Streptomyces TaxID=2593676 RepID=UPI00369B2D05
MTESLQTTLVLGGTGRTGSLLARRLAERGRNARTAARHGADVLFDWDNPATHADALCGVDSLYLVTPVMRVAYADQVAIFLDLAEAAGVRHVTYLSTYGADHARSTTGPGTRPPARRPSRSVKSPRSSPP